MKDYEPRHILTKKERRGMLALLMVISFLVSFYFVEPYLLRKSNFNYSTFSDEIENYYRANDQDAQDNVVIAQEPFDINEITTDKLIESGLSHDLASRWVKYREAIGGFDSVEQVNNIYHLDKQWYKANYDKFRLTKTNSTRTDIKPVKPTELELFTFDPNKVSNSELKALGFLPRTIAAFEKYRFKGGSFYAADELKYLDGMDSSFFERILPFVAIDTSEIQAVVEMGKELPLTAPDTTSKILETKPILLDINESNVYQWQLIKGIGPKYANRIVQYRSHLGGFSNIAQVGETYYLPDSVFQSIKSQLVVSSPPTRRLKINQLTADSLRLHPYIDWKQASIIENYRQQHGPYQEVDDLYKVKVFDSVFIEKIRPYCDLVL
ncbi:MAG: helix-hairpin-helix domain-containing protein [Saprospiraceae bacterium]|nr:helix-hairpin-helix domain-containing protein [Saprospiraceae bacterium]